MANRRTMIMGVVAGVVVVGGAATVVAFHRHQSQSTKSVSTTPVTVKTASTLPASGGPQSAPLQMPAAGKVAKDFGWQYSGALNEWYYNPGITIAAHKGTSVRAAWSGRVTNVNRQPRLGLTLTVMDGDGFETVYGHLGQAKVQAGQTVHQGEVIGTVGAASLYSRSSGSHVDFQVYHGTKATNPTNYLHPSS